VTDDALSAIRELAMPVVVIAAVDERGVAAATATTAYASIEPAQLAVPLVAGSRTARAVATTRALSVSILAESQSDIAVRAGRHSEADDKLAHAGIATVAAPNPSGPPGVAGATVLWCKVVDMVQTGDHVVYLVEVASVGKPPGAASPLVRFRRGYHLVALDPLAVQDERYPL
jgi:flavin reductase (DIM6/NTAB) family NADH-FMN oxidoreductase RutF